MNFRKNKFQNDAEVYTASLNDIMFFLMLFFLLISTMSNPSVIKLILPKSSPAQTVPKQQVTVSVTNDKTYYINKDAVPFEQLESQLAVALSSTTDPTIVLRMDNALIIQDLVDVLQVGNNLKVKMVLATKIVQN